jgi:hypothetical protein
MLKAIKISPPKLIIMVNQSKAIIFFLLDLLKVIKIICKLGQTQEQNPQFG